MNCKAVFFDLDDTLYHAARAWRKAEQEAFDSLMLYSYPGLTELDDGECGNPFIRTSLHNWTIICSRWRMCVISDFKKRWMNWVSQI